MKIFKKTAAMILALALLCSLCVFASAAVVYPDESTITHKEAVSVLTELEVLQGDGEGFRPTDGLTRAEGCTIIAKLLGHGNDYGISGFTDMDAAVWAEDAVAFCKDMGIVCGNGNGTFSPNEPLTGAAFGKMLLGCLGYDAASEGMIGSAWVGNVTRLAKQAGLLLELPAFSGKSAICREDAAQMAFNTLKATMVEYSGGTRISNGDMSLTINGAREKMAAVGADYRGDRENATCEFCEYHFADLKRAHANDAGFGRPGHEQWTWKGRPVYVLDAEATLLESYHTSVKTGTLYSLIGKEAFEAIQKGTSMLTVYLDGEKQEADPEAFFARRGNDFVPNSGNGVLTEVYMDDQNNVTVVQIKTYLAQVNEDYDAQWDEVSVSVFGNKSMESSVLAGDAFSVSSCAMDDWLLIQTDCGQIVSAEPARKVTGKLTGYTAGRNLTLSGSQYAYAAAFDSEYLTQVEWKLGSNMTLILDASGYVLAMEAEQETMPDRIFLLDSGYSVSMDDRGRIFYTYASVCDGRIGTTDLNDMILGSGLYGNLVKDENGYLDAASLVPVSTSPDSFAFLHITDEELSYASGMLTVKECRMNAKDCSAFIADESGEITACTVSQLVSSIRRSASASLYGTCTGGKVTTAFALLK